LAVVGLADAVDVVDVVGVVEGVAVVGFTVGVSVGRAVGTLVVGVVKGVVEVSPPPRTTRFPPFVALAPFFMEIVALAPFFMEMIPPPCLPPPSALLIEAVEIVSTVPEYTTFSKKL
jgi:hypothetical protein